MLNEQNKMADAMKKNAQLAYTENGGLTYKIESIENPWVKVFYQVSSFRQRFSEHAHLATRFQACVDNDDAIMKDYRAALDLAAGTEYENYGIRLALFVRDITLGMGERALGRLMFIELANRSLVRAQALVKVLCEDGYGRWDDVIAIVQLTKNRALADELDQLIVAQLKKDRDAITNGQASTGISLLAKWMPSISTTSKLTRRLARHYMRLMKLDNRGYRQLLSSLRRHLKIVEQKICAQEWEAIDYSTVPSKAALRYAQVFSTHDGERYSNFLDAVKIGAAKINAQTLTAPEIIAKVRENRDSLQDQKANEVLWKALPELKLERHLLPVCDVSGSMCTNVGSLQAIDVSLGLSLYLAQSNTGPFKDLVMSFSADSRINDLSTKCTLLEKWNALNEYEGYNTNIDSALRQLWTLAKNHNVTQDELPSLVFFSDMEFDSMNHCRKETSVVFEHYQKEFEAIGLKMPQVIFWNICNRTATVPMRENDLGMVLCSGFSQQIMEAVLANDFPTPWAMLKATLDKERYGVLDRDPPIE